MSSAWSCPACVIGPRPAALRDGYLKFFAARVGKRMTVLIAGVATALRRLQLAGNLRELRQRDSSAPSSWRPAT